MRRNGLQDKVRSPYRGTSLIRNNPLLGPYRCLRHFGGPRGGGCFL